ncbi:MAG: hypothetical protein WDW36_000258 [Sanguina aurantia]
MFRVLLDTLCEATGTTPGIELIGHYPCGDPSWLSRSAFLFKQLPTALHSFISATHPLTGPYPNEIWALSPLVFIIPASCLAVTSPQLGLKLRSWLWMLSSLACSVTPLIGLLTHPNHPPSTYWTSCLPVCGALLQAHRIIFRLHSHSDPQPMRSASAWCDTPAATLRGPLRPAHPPAQIEGLPRCLHLGAWCLVSLTSMLLLPTVYPRVALPWFTLPLLALGALASLPFLVQSARRSAAARPDAQHPTSTAPSAAHKGGTQGPALLGARPSASASASASAAASASCAARPTPGRAPHPAGAAAVRRRLPASGLAPPALPDTVTVTATLLLLPTQGAHAPTGASGSGSGASAAVVEQAARTASAVGVEGVGGGGPAAAAAGAAARGVAARQGRDSLSGDDCEVDGSDGEAASEGTSRGSDDLTATMLALRGRPYVSKVSGGVRPLGHTTIAETATGSSCVATRQGGTWSNAWLRECARLAASPPLGEWETRARRYRVVTKIPHMEPHQLPPDFLQLMAQSLSQHPTHPSLIVGVAMKSGCIELVLDVVAITEEGSGGGAGGAGAGGGEGPAQLGFVDPGTWLHHLHVLPPPGTEVLTQACGSVWRSKWDESLSPPQWALSPYPLPLGKLPRLLRAPGVLLLRRTPRILPTTPDRNAIVTLPTASDSATGASCDSCALQLEVSVFGAVPDISVRCCGRYLESSSVMHRRDSRGPARGESGACRSFTVTLTGPLPSRGLLTVESKLGWMVSDSTPLLLTDDADIAAEVERILSCTPGSVQAAQRAGSRSMAGQIGAGHAREDSAAHHNFIVDLGTWFDFLDSRADSSAAAASASASASHTTSALPAAAQRSIFRTSQPAPTQHTPSPHPSPHAVAKSIYHTPAMRTHMSKIGVSLLVACVGKACPKTAASVMRGLLSLGHPYPWVLARCEAEISGATTLLQHAKNSGCTATQSLILNFGAEHGAPWADDSSSRGGLPRAVPDSAASVAAASAPAAHADSSAPATVDEQPAVACEDVACGGVVPSEPETRTPGLSTSVQPRVLRESVHPDGGSTPQQRETQTGRLSGTDDSAAHSDATAVGTAVPSAVEPGLSTHSAAQGPGATGSNSSSSGTAAAALVPSGQAGAASSAAAGPSQAPVPAPPPPFPTADYRAWLYQQNAVYSEQFFTIIFYLMLLVAISRFWRGHSAQELAFVAYLSIHVIKVVGQRRHPAWFASHRESQNLVWCLVAAGCKVAPVFSGCAYGAGPPLPYLMKLDWVMEGALPVLCVPEARRGRVGVRPDAPDARDRPRRRGGGWGAGTTLARSGSIAGSVGNPRSRSGAHRGEGARERGLLPASLSRERTPDGLCAQGHVRPSITVLLRAFDVYLSSALYLRYHMVSSPALAVGIACTWNLAAVMLCVFLDQRNRRAFLRSRAEAPVRAHHPDKGRAKSE